MVHLLVNFSVGTKKVDTCCSFYSDVGVNTPVITSAKRVDDTPEMATVSWVGSTNVISILRYTGDTTSDVSNYVSISTLV